MEKRGGLLEIDDHDVGRGAGGGEVVAETYGLHVCGFESELDEMLAHGLGAALGEGACVIVGQGGRCVTGDEELLFLCG